MDELITKNSNIEEWIYYSELFFLENPDQLKHELTSHLDIVCKKTNPEFEKSLFVVR